MNDYTDKQTLKEAYQRNSSYEATAEEFGCSRITISRWMDKHGLKATMTRNAPYEDKEILQEIYNRYNSFELVAEHFDISVGTVTRWVRRLEIETNGSMRAEDSTKIKLECENCGDTIYEFPSRVEVKNRHFCDKSCQDEWQKTGFVGENNPHWKGGRVTEYGWKWREARINARERDGDTCRLCDEHVSESTRDFDVHHIEPIKSFEDPNDAHKLENLVSVCRVCHRFLENYTPKFQKKLL